MPAKTFDQHTAAEQEFIDHRTRQLLVTWCEKALGQEGEIALDITTAPTAAYVSFALSKKWLSVKAVRPDSINTYRVLAAGYMTAARFLKR